MKGDDISKLTKKEICALLLAYFTVNEYINNNPMQIQRRPTREEELFGDLRRAVLKPQPREQHRNAWISEETWRLIDERYILG